MMLKYTAALIGIGALMGCASGPALNTAGPVTAACAGLPASTDDEPVVVMRDRSSSTTVAGAVPVGVGALGDSGVALVGPVAVTKDATAGVYRGVSTSVEMQPCAPAAASDPTPFP